MERALAAPSTLSRLRTVVLACAPIPVVLAGLSWYFTAPLVESASSLPPPSVGRLETAVAGVSVPDRALDAEGGRVAVGPAKASWPDARLDGDAAKELLLEYLLATRERLRPVKGYTATLYKQERLRNKLGPVQTIALKVRHEPFSVYMHFLAPEAGKEVIYQHGRHKNQLIGHFGGISRRLLPRVQLDPESPLALADNRQPITKAGLANLVDKLIHYRELDLGDVHASTVLDRYVDEQGRSWLRSTHVHAVNNGARPFREAEVLYHPDTGIPHRFQGFDWPRDDQSTSERVLGESYTYEAVDFGARLEDRDFDPANPEYAFTRF